MLRKLLFAILVGAVSASLSQAQSCSSYNVPFHNLQEPTDATEHSTGFHQAVMILNGSCSYASQPNTSDCSIQCAAAIATHGVNEQGSINNGDQHGTNDAIAQGGAGSNGPQVSCGGQVGGQ